MGSPLTPSSTRPAIPRRTGQPCVSALQPPALARQLRPCPRRLRPGTTASGGSHFRPSQLRTGSGRFLAPVGADYCSSAEHRHPEHRSGRPCPFRRLSARVPGMRPFQAVRQQARLGCLQSGIKPRGYATCRQLGFLAQNDSTSRPPLPIRPIALLAPSLAPCLPVVCGCLR